MTDEDRLLLIDLKANLQQLFQEVEVLEKDKKMLENDRITLKNELDRLKQEKIILSQEQEKLKIANRILSGNDGDKQAKQRINKIVREIDKCIALLNK
ncbi:MAG TPA: hypothetical protein VKA10_10785 [Prolixibacteraceae bacterium]|nr:hypothetical protein [Prolixibacteraceae bacterium]